jgi:Lipase (class 3)
MSQLVVNLNAVCNMAGQLSRIDRSALLDPVLIDVEELPPVPRGPDPSPPPPPVPPIQPGNPPKLGWTSTDCYWWATLLRALSVPWTDTYLQQTIAAKGGISGYQRQVFPGDSPNLAFAFGQMSDRFYVLIEGTQNENQALSFLFTHLFGSQVLAAGSYWNTTWVGQAADIVLQVQPAFIAAGRPPLCVVGHSYGAAVAPVVANLLGAPRVGGFDRVVAFGVPRHFTFSGMLANGPLQYLRFSTVDDLVTLLPPPQIIMRALSGVVSPGAYPGGDYSNINPCLFLLGRNGVAPQNDPVPDPTTWATQFLQWLVNFQGLTPHFIGTYSDLARRWNDNTFTSPPNYVDFETYTDLYTINANLAALGV